MQRAHSLAAGLAAASALAALPAAAAAEGGHTGRTWYVQAGAAEGTGSFASPFGSLAEVEAASGPDDRIAVLSGPPTAAPLDGGIALKPRQRLAGLGPGSRITNTDATRNQGAGVVLADGVEVANLHVLDTARAGMVGHDVSGVRIRGNLITGFNRSNGVNYCFSGIVVPVVGCFITPHPAIDLRLDEPGREQSIRISGNAIRDAQGSGITVRAAGSARATLRIARNRLENLDVNLVPGAGQIQHSEGVLVNTFDRARANVRLTGNLYDSIGTGASNSDTNLFVLDGASRQKVRIAGDVRRNTERVGGPSATAIEVWGPLTEAPGARLDLVVEDGDYRGMTSDAIQMARGGGNIAIRATVADTFIGEGIGAGPPMPPPGVPLFNSGSCIHVGERIGGGTTPSPSPTSIWLDVIRSRLEGCKSAGITFQNAPELESGRLRIRDSHLAGNGLANLWVESFPVVQTEPKARLSVSAADSDFVGSPRGIVILDATRQTAASVIDLGGGPLGSPGRNRILRNGTDVEVAGLAVSATRNWWGSPSGPEPGQILLSGGATLTTRPVLATDPRPDR